MFESYQLGLRILSVEAPSLASLYGPTVRCVSRPPILPDNRTLKGVITKTTNHYVVAYGARSEQPIQFSSLRRGVAFSIDPFSFDGFNYVQNSYSRVLRYHFFPRVFNPDTMAHHSLVDIRGPWCAIRLQWPGRRNAVFYRIYHVDRRIWCPVSLDGYGNKGHCCVINKADQDTITWVSSSVEKEGDGDGNSKHSTYVVLKWWRWSVYDAAPCCIRIASIGADTIHFQYRDTSFVTRVDNDRLLVAIPQKQDVLAVLHRCCSAQEALASTLDTSSNAILWRVNIAEYCIIRDVCTNIDSFIASCKDNVYIYSLIDGTLKHHISGGNILSFQHLIGRAIYVQLKNKRKSALVDILQGQKTCVSWRSIPGWSPMKNARKMLWGQYMFFWDYLAYNSRDDDTRLDNASSFSGPRTISLASDNNDAI
jgi:hypothetical protein